MSGSNHNGKIKTVRDGQKIPAESVQGMCDYLDGITWNKEYETWDKYAQISYEFGRLAACNIDSAGLQFPRIKRNAKVLPFGFVETYAKSHKVCGIEVSHNFRMPPDTDLQFSKIPGRIRRGIWFPGPVPTVLPK